MEWMPQMMDYHVALAGVPLPILEENHSDFWNKIHKGSNYDEQGKLF
jgi:hypothetical protein